MYISKMLVKKIISHHIIEKRKYSTDVYEYGIELILGDLLNYALVIIMGVLSGQDVYIPLLYLICFVSVRIYSGGFHAATHVGCSIFMIIFYFIFTLIWQVVMNIATLYAVILTIILYLPVVIFAPVKNSRRYMDKTKAKICRVKALYLYIIWVLSAIIMITADIKAGYAILAALYIISLNIIFAELVQLMERNI